MEERINLIVEDCDNLQADDTMVVTEFGFNRDLTIYIHKDCDYDPEKDSDAYNIVSLSTKQNNEFVDDTGDVYITDGSLFRELKRIWNYESFNIL